ncbi:MAG: hypothetical protein M5T61_05265 [Acidimicrobiia bacterium]|nr:hypothetical protein [Acidimicrobiia bacterium]
MPTGADAPGADTEARLRDALSAYAGTVEPAPGAWARLRGRVDGTGRTSRRAVVAVLAGAGAVAAAIALVVVLTGDGDGSGGGVDMIPATPPTSGAEAPVTTGTPTTATTTPAPTTTTVAVPYGADGVVAATADGRVVLLDVDGGEVRTLVDATDGEQVTQVALDPDRAHLWYLSKPSGTGGYGCGTLYEVATAEGATPEEHGTANYFALSPDGGHVALSLHFDESDRQTCTDSLYGAISVRSTATGDELARLETGLDTETGPWAPSWLAWSPGDARLAASFCWEECDTRVFEIPFDAPECPPGSFCPRRRSTTPTVWRSPPRARPTTRLGRRTGCSSSTSTAATRRRREVAGSWRSTPRPAPAARCSSTTPTRRCEASPPTPAPPPHTRATPGIWWCSTRTPPTSGFLRRLRPPSPATSWPPPGPPGLVDAGGG